MMLKIVAPQTPLQIRTSASGLDIVVPFTTRLLTRAALSAAQRLSAGLLPLIRMVRTQVVPFPLQLDSAPVSTAVLRKELVPLAGEFGAQVQFLFARDSRKGLLHCVAQNSVVVIATRKRWWKTREERLASWLSAQGCRVVLEFVEKNCA